MLTAPSTLVPSSPACTSCVSIRCAFPAISTLLTKLFDYTLLIIRLRLLNYSTIVYSLFDYAEGRLSPEFPRGSGGPLPAAGGAAADPDPTRGRPAAGRQNHPAPGPRQELRQHGGLRDHGRAGSGAAGLLGAALAQGRSGGPAGGARGGVPRRGASPPAVGARSQGRIRRNPPAPEAHPRGGHRLVGAPAGYGLQGKPGRPV